MWQPRVWSNQISNQIQSMIKLNQISNQTKYDFSLLEYECDDPEQDIIWAILTVAFIQVTYRQQIKSFIQVTNRQQIKTFWQILPKTHYIWPVKVFISNIQFSDIYPDHKKINKLLNMARVKAWTFILSGNLGWHNHKT